MPSDLLFPTGIGPFSSFPFSPLTSYRRFFLALLFSIFSTSVGTSSSDVVGTMRTLDLLSCGDSDNELSDESLGVESDIGLSDFSIVLASGESLLTGCV